MTRADPRSQAARGRLRPVPEPDREPPHNLEAEEAVLGAVLAAGRLLAEVVAVVEEVDFYRQRIGPSGGPCSGWPTGASRPTR